MMKEKLLIPKKRFNNFGVEWKEIKFNEVVNYRHGKAHEKNVVQNGKYVIVNSKLISTEGKVRKYTNDFIEPLYLNELAMVLSDIPNGKALGKVYLIKTNDRYTLNQRILGITPKKNINSIFLMNRINRHNYLLSFDDGSNQTNLKNEDLEQFEIIIPCIKEQEKIGEFFKVLDERIANQERKITKVKALKEAYLTEMFPQEGETVPKRRFKGFEGEWEAIELKDVTDYENGTGHESEVVEKGKYELINLNSISITGGLKPSGKFVNNAKSLLIRNDIVMILSDVGHGDLLGKVALIPQDDKYVLNQRVALLRPKKSINSLYLMYYLNSEKHYFKNNGAGMSQLNINKNIVENYKLKLPIIEEQTKIGEFFKNLDGQIEAEEKKLEKLKKTKEAYLEEMFV